MLLSYMKPNVILSPFSEKKITIEAFGRPDDFALRAFKEGDEPKQKMQGGKISEILKNSKVKKIFIPFTSEFTGRVAKREEFKKTFELPEKKTLLYGTS